MHAKRMAEFALGVLLFHEDQFMDALNDKKEKIFRTPYYRGTHLHGKKMLIVGTGHIGVELAKRALAFEISVDGVNTTGHVKAPFEQTFSIAELDTIAKNYDIIVNILPLTDATIHVYDEKFFANIKHGMYFVNIGRGQSVDENALIHALQDETVAYAALDVFEHEPLDKNSPLYEMDNVFITPHMAGNLENLTQHMLDEFFLPNLASYVADGTIHRGLVNIQRGY
jgi:phosphoglycerate dehydrogenase-like enzyme